MTERPKLTRRPRTLSEPPTSFVAPRDRQINEQAGSSEGEIPAMRTRANSNPAKARRGSGGSIETRRRSHLESLEEQPPGHSSMLYNTYRTSTASSRGTSVSRSSSFWRGGEFGQSVRSSLVNQTLAEFKRDDVNPRRERMILYALQRLEESNRAAQAAAASTERSRKKEKGDRSRESSVVRPGMGGAVRRERSAGRKSVAITKLNSLLTKKKKKKSRGGAFHLMLLAIHDNKTSFVCSLLDELTGSDLTKKRPQDANRVFLSALANGLENVCMVMLEKGFPSNVNAPVLNPEQEKNGTVGVANMAQSTPRFTSPSYFVMSVGLGMDNIVRCMFKQARVDVNQGWYGMTALHIACSKGNLGLVQQLLDYGADVNQGLSFKQYMLLRQLKSVQSRRVMRSVYGEHYAPPRLNCLNVSEEEYIQQQRRTMELERAFAESSYILPIDLASAGAHLDVVRLLISRMQTRIIASSTFCLLVQRDPMISAHLLKAGANPNQRDALGATPLHIAARMGSLDVCVTLIQGGADMNATSENNWTPLHEALSMRKRMVVQYLLKCGASSETTDGFDARKFGKAAGLCDDDILDMFGQYAPEMIQREAQMILSYKSVAAYTHNSLPRSSSSATQSLVSTSSAAPSGTSGDPTSAAHRKGRRKATVSGMGGMYVGQTTLQPPIGNVDVLNSKNFATNSDPGIPSNTGFPGSMSSISSGGTMGSPERSRWQEKLTGLKGKLLSGIKKEKEQSETIKRSESKEKGSDIAT